MSEVIVVFLWWLAIQLLGYAVWPLLARWLRWLPDRGYMLSKPIGLLFTAYAVWLLASIGLVQNSSGGIIAVAIGWAILSVWAYRTDRHEEDASLIGLWREHRNLFIAYEIVFALALVAWATFRMHAPDLSTTEKPMEFAFFNAINRSPFFPPHDPWLSDYAIAYYYFGYVMMSVMHKLTGVTAGIAFSLSNAFWFALAAASAFGVTANVVLLLARGRKPAAGTAQPVQTALHKVQAATIAFGVLGAIMLVLMGNLIGPLEVAHANAVGSPEFWQWLDIRELNRPALQNPPEVPWWTPRPGWWWWRGSRVLHDYPPDQVSPVLASVAGLPAADPDTYQEVIDEFPQFSFLLGDMHPHVLALPFVVVMMGLALNLYLGAARGHMTRLWSAPWWPFYALAVGGLSFLNTWDFPIYAFVMIAALGLGYWRARKTHWWEVVYDALVLGALGLACYLLFYRGFTSQAAGIAPNLYNGTRFAQFFVMFGTFLTIGLLFSLALIAQAVRRKQTSWKRFTGLSLAGGLGVVIVLAALGLGLGYGVTIVFERARTALANTLAAMAQNGLSLSAHLQARVSDPWTPLLLAVALVAIVLLWLVRRKENTLASFLSSLKGPSAEADTAVEDAADSPLDFVLLLFAAGVLLTLSTEFVFLADTFGYRMNTIFKFYYQAWALWSIASACAAYYLILGMQTQRMWRWLLALIVAVMVFLGLIYPAMALPTMMVENETPTLDALEYTARSIPDQAAAIRWLDRNVPGRHVILEAPGEQYQPDTSRFSTWTGLPTVVGWAGHENQWRGTTDIYGPRLDQVREIYTTGDPARMMELLNGFKVRYIIVSSNERRLYPAAGLAKFAQYFPVVFEQGEVTIYQVP
jgi:YYY domain-containing protein